MRSLLSACSMRIARMASFALRANDIWLVSSMFLATCWVIVDAPIGRFPCPAWAMSNTAARAIANGSMPRWVKKF